MKITFSVLLWLLAIGIPQINLKAQVPEPLRYHGVIIGINEYDYWGDLRRARKDAEALVEVLSDKYDFDSVTTLFDADASAASIEETLRRVASQLNEQDALLIFFSGHGYYDDLLEQGFWIPADGRLEIDGQPAIRDWIENDRIKQYLGKCAAKHVLVVSDACFSGSLFKGGYTGINPTTMSWYQHVAGQPSRWAITSGDMEMVPDAGVFGMKLLQLLKFPPREVFSVSDLAGWLKKEVSAFDGSLPLAGPLHDPNHALGGEFVFVEKGIESAFWTEDSIAEDKNFQQNTAQVMCYSNMDSQVYLEGRWVGFVKGGESILVEVVRPGECELVVKSDAGIFQRKLEVAPGSVTHANAIFFSKSEEDSQSMSRQSSDSILLHLGMDEEHDPRFVGMFENNGAMVTRDAIRGNALRFQQRGHVSFHGSHFDHFGKGDFVVSLWFKWMGDPGEDAGIFFKEDQQQNVIVDITGGYLFGRIKNEDPLSDGLSFLQSQQPLETGVWHHVVFQRSGNRLELWLNGELQDSVQHPTQWDLSNLSPIVLGFNSVHFNMYFSGIMDELELRERAMSPEQIKDQYHLKFEKYRITRKHYSEREDLDLIAKKLYGGSAHLADWEEITTRFAGEMDAFWEYLGLKTDDRVWMTYLNRRFFNSARHFYALTTVDPDQIDEEIHQRFDTEERVWVLSSWINMKLPMLIEL